jgi:hypothetical protein
MNYDTIKALAREQRCKVTDLIALARNNDPFYVGTDGDKEWARWFADLYARFGYMQGIHLRRAHYQIISQDPPITLPVTMKIGEDEHERPIIGNTYLNTDECWAALCDAGKAARYLGLVDPGAFVDRRNPEPHIFMPGVNGTPYVYTTGAIDAYDTELPDFPGLPTFDLENYRGEQRYHIEIWCEKSTMNDILIPLCQQYGVNLITGIGELSITAALAAVGRAEERGKPVRIFYVSDFDPAGQSMPAAVARKIEYFLYSKQIDADMRLYPIVLTYDQCKLHQLPRTPIKPKERRAGRFQERYGAGATELDALEALHAGELRRILTAHIERYYDTDLDRRVRAAERRARAEFETIEQDVYDRYTEDIASLEAEYGAIRRDFEQRMAVYSERITRVWRAIQNDLDTEQPDLADYPIPESDGADEHDAPLYDSTRDYLTQLPFYKDFQGRESVV